MPGRLEYTLDAGPALAAATTDSDHTSRDTTRGQGHVSHDGPRVYLTGPMTGYPDNNRDAFLAAAEHLRATGAEVYSTYERMTAAQPHGEGGLSAFGAEAVDALQRCDVVAYLPGSPEAMLPEFVLADLFGLPTVLVFGMSQTA